MKKIRLIMAACAMLGATSALAQESGEYYLYDAAKQVYLTRGYSWGTKAAADKYGMLITWDTTEGTLTFKDSGLRLFVTNDGSLFTDNTTNSTGWQFNAVEGGYTLSYGETGQLLGYPEEGSNAIQWAASEEEAIVWTLETRAEHDARIAGYQTANFANIIAKAGLDCTPETFVETINNTNVFAGKDYTASIGTAKFAGSNGDWTYNVVRTQGGQPAFGTNYAEFWQATGTLSQTVSDLASGIYKVTFNGFERNGSNAGCTSLGDEGYELVTSSFDANEASVLLASWYSGQTDGNNPNNTTQANTKFNEGKYQNEVYTYVGEDGKLQLTLNIPSYVGDRWTLINNFTLTYFTDQVSTEDAEALLASIPEGKMNAELAAALAEAKTAFEGAQTIANYNVLAAAITEAKASVDAYAAAAPAIAKAEDFIANNTFATAESIAAFNAVLEPLKKGYEGGTLTTAEANNATAALAMGITGWHADSGISGDVLASAWEATKDGWNGYKYYVNSWSVEGETDGTNFVVPFIEAWVGSGDLPTDELKAQLTGLEPNSPCTVSLWARVETTTDEAPVANTITMSVNGGEAVDIAAGEQLEGTKFYLGNFTAEGTTDADGNINLAIAIGEGSNVHWLSFKNVTYTVTPVEVSAIEATINFNDSTYETSNNSNAGDIAEELTINVTDGEGAFTMTVTPSYGSTPNRFWSATAGPQLRVYGGSILFTAPEGMAISSIASSTAKWNAGNTFNGKAAEKGEWEGNASSVLLQIAANTQFNSITLTLKEADEETTPAYIPEISSISKVKTVPLGTQLKLNLDEATITLHSSNACTMYSFIQDATGGAKIDITLSKLDGIMGNEGKSVSGYIYTQASFEESGMLSLTKADSTSLSAVTVNGDSNLEPKVVTISELLAAPQKYLAQLITLQNVGFSSVEPETYYDDPTYYLTETRVENADGVETEVKDSILLYDQFYLMPYPMPNYQTFLNIPGFIDYAFGAYEYHPYGEFSAELAPAVEVGSIAELRQLSDGTDVKLTLNEAKVTVYEMGHMGTTCFIEDATGGIEVNANGGGIWSLDPAASCLADAMGIVGDSVQFDGVLYCTYFNSYGSMYLAMNDSTTRSEIVRTDNVAIEPTVLTTKDMNEQLERYNMCLVKVVNASIVSEGWDTFLAQGEDRVGLADQFGRFYTEEGDIVVPDSVTSLTGLLIDWGEGYGATIYPLYYEVYDPTTDGISTINANGIINGDIFTIDGKRLDITDGKLNGLKKGIYIINRKKVVVK
ncbi:MAG: hypothetical protein ACI3ZB_04325 [Prevotella sp.]